MAIICLGILILFIYIFANNYINEGFSRGRIIQPVKPLTPPSYFNSCGNATQYGCNTCLNAVIKDAPSTKCGWTETKYLVNGNQKQYTCESGGVRVCPK